MSTLVTNAPIPVSDPIARLKNTSRYGPKEKDPNENKITPQWIDFFSQQSQLISQSSTRINSVYLTAQDASIGATDITSGSISAGFYRLTYYARISQAATNSSSLEVTFDWTDTTNPSETDTAITGNTTVTVASRSWLIRVDGAPIRYSTTYASVGATPMQYALYVLLEQIQT